MRSETQTTSSMIELRSLIPFRSTITVLQIVSPCRILLNQIRKTCLESQHLTFFYARVEPSKSKDKSVFLFFVCFLFFFFLLDSILKLN